MIAATNYGPFAEAVGYVIALGSTITAFAVTWRGKLKKWKPPEEVLPSAAQKIAVLLSIVFVALAFFYARPDLLKEMYWTSAKLGVVVFISFIIYTILIVTFRFENVRVKNRKTGGHEFRDILGGLWLSKNARNGLRNGFTTPDGKKVPPPPTVESLLEGIDGDISWVWPRFSRALCVGLVDALFIAILFLGNIAVGCAGFALQVHLTGKPAAPEPKPNIIVVNAHPSRTQESPCRYINTGHEFIVRLHHVPRDANMSLRVIPRGYPTDPWNVEIGKTKLPRVELINKSKLVLTVGNETETLAEFYDPNPTQCADHEFHLLNATLEISRETSDR